MSQTDLIGWGSLALFAVFFALLYRFITTPSRKLEKSLGDGRALGLWKLPRDSPELDLLADALTPLLGAHGKSFRLGSVYKTERGAGYLFSVVEISKADRPGGESAEHQDHEKIFWRAPHRLAPFAVRHRPQNDLGVELSAKLLEKMGRHGEMAESGLSPAFHSSFVVYGGASGQAGVPAEVQRVFVEAARNAPCASGDAVGRPVAVTAIEEIEGIVFTPDGFLIHLAARLRSRSQEQLRQVLHFAERIAQGIAV